jgi:hypothetical protein
MKLRLSAVALGCMFGLMVAGVADAQPQIRPPGQPQQPQQQPQQQPAGGILNGTTAQHTARMMQEAGYTDVQFVEHGGRRHVRANAGESPVVVIHDSCQDENCTVISFTVFFGEQRNIDAKYINAWNATKRWAKLYRAENGSLILDMDVYVAGVQPEYVKAMSILFANMLKQLFQFKPS